MEWSLLRGRCSNDDHLRKLKNIKISRLCPSEFLDQLALTVPSGVFLCLPCGSADKESTYNAGHLVRSLGWEEPLEKERLPTPVFWPGEFHGLYSPWVSKELDTTEQLSLSLSGGKQEATYRW